VLTAALTETVDAEDGEADKSSFDGGADAVVSRRARWRDAILVSTTAETDDISFWLL